jgi:hypothetical protein
MSIRSFSYYLYWAQNFSENSLLIRCDHNAPHGFPKRVILAPLYVSWEAILVQRGAVFYCSQEHQWVLLADDRGLDVCFGSFAT